MSDASFWDNQEKANVVVTELKTVKSQTDAVAGIASQLEDASLLWEMAEEADDQDSRDEVDGEIDGIEKKLDKVETMSLLGGKHDASNCFLSIFSREGGTEA